MRLQYALVLAIAGFASLSDQTPAAAEDCAAILSDGTAVSAPCAPFSPLPPAPHGATQWLPPAQPAETQWLTEGAAGAYAAVGPCTVIVDGKPRPGPCPTPAAQPGAEPQSLFLTQTPDAGGQTAAIAPCTVIVDGKPRLEPCQEIGQQEGLFIGQSGPVVINQSGSVVSGQSWPVVIGQSGPPPDPTSYVYKTITLNASEGVGRCAQFLAFSRRPGAKCDVADRPEAVASLTCEARGESYACFSPQTGDLLASGALPSQTLGVSRPQDVRDPFRRPTDRALIDGFEANGPRYDQERGIWMHAP